MGKKIVMLPANEVDLSSVEYVPELVQAPHITGYLLKLVVQLLETRLIGSFYFSFMKNKNNVTQLLRNTSVPEAPMFRPEFSPQDPEVNVVAVEEDGLPTDRVEAALSCLPPHTPPTLPTLHSEAGIGYWKIRDYAQVYRSKLASPLIVAERIISAILELRVKKPQNALLIAFDPEDVRKQAAASTRRFEEGSPLSILDGIFIAIKDDIDCYPYPTKGGTTFLHEIRPLKEDAVSVSKLRSCGAILIGKANMHEFGLGTTGNNPNYGTTRNPYAEDRYTGGSSSGPAAIVSMGLCSAALGTDGGGSVRIPSALCGVVALKATYGRIDMKGSLCGKGTVEVLGPIASSVEDLMLVYAAILGSAPGNRLSLRPSPPCFPCLSSHENPHDVGSLRLGKYTKWFNDIDSTDISDKCEDILNLLSKTHGCKVLEVVIPELAEMRVAHLVSIGCECLSSLNPTLEAGWLTRLSADSRTSMALFRSFSGADYVQAQCYRRRIMHYHMEAFRKVDIIVTPTTGMTAPIIPESALELGESNMQVTGRLMQFIIAANLLGLPAISVPVGYDKQGLPIGLQLIGRPWGEASLLRLASAIEELCAPSRKTPPSFYDVLSTK
uniref:Amidase domain-containing protein n=1 Tax=Kalanchoe fedtschenkoi TaxID=63787 RepID=A0A7N0T0W1_KALFE